MLNKTKKWAVSLLTEIGRVSLESSWCACATRETATTQWSWQPLSIENVLMVYLSIDFAFWS